MTTTSKACVGTASTASLSIALDLNSAILEYPLQRSLNEPRASVLQQYFVGVAPQLAGKNRHHATLAKTALAPTHAGTAAALDALDRNRAWAASDRGHDLGLGHCLAAAYDLPPRGIGLDQLLLARKRCAVKVVRRTADRDPNRRARAKQPPASRITSSMRSAMAGALATPGD